MVKSLSKFPVYIRSIRKQRKKKLKEKGRGRERKVGERGRAQERKEGREGRSEEGRKTGRVVLVEV